MPVKPQKKLSQLHLYIKITGLVIFTLGVTGGVACVMKGLHGGLLVWTSAGLGISGLILMSSPEAWTNALFGNVFGG